MADPTNNPKIGEDPKNPNFALIVLMSAAALIIIFIGAYFVVGAMGRKLVPPRHTDPQPTSYLAQPVASRVA